MVHAEHRDRRREREVRVGEQRLLVEERELGALGRGRRPERRRPRQARRRRGEQVPCEQRPQQPVALELDVVAERDVADAHHAHQGRDRAGRELAVLQAQVERVQQVRRRRRPVRDELPRDVGPVHDPRRDRVDGLTPAVRAEVRAGQLQHTRVVALRVEVRGGVLPVLRDLLRPLQVVAVEGAGPQRGQVHEQQQPEQHRDRDRPPAPLPRPQAVDRGGGAGAEQPREPEDHERHRASGAPQRERDRRALRQVLERRAHRGRAVVRVRADRDHHADDHERREVDAVAPPHEHAGEQRERGHQVGDEDEDRPLGVRGARLDPRPQPVAAVEEPVAEPAEDLVGQRRARDDPQRLGVLQDVEAVGALRPQARDPPRRRQEREQPDLGDRARRTRRQSTSRSMNSAYGIHRTGATPANTSAVTFTLPITWMSSAKSAAWRHPPRRSARISSASIHGSPAHGSRSTDRRAAYSSQYGLSAYSSVPTTAPDPRSPIVRKRNRMPSAGGEEDAAEPDALRDPVGHPEAVEGPVPRTHREQVADVLVGDRPHADVRVPHRPRALEHTAGVEVQVLLRVRDDPARVGEQHREVRERGEEAVPDPPLDGRALSRRRRPGELRQRHAHGSNRFTPTPSPFGPCASATSTDVRAHRAERGDRRLALRAERPVPARPHEEDPAGAGPPEHAGREPVRRCRGVAVGVVGPVDEVRRREVRERHLRHAGREQPRRARAELVRAVRDDVAGTQLRTERVGHRRRRGPVGAHHVPARHQPGHREHRDRGHPHARVEHRGRAERDRHREERERHRDVPVLEPGARDDRADDPRRRSWRARSRRRAARPCARRARAQPHPRPSSATDASGDQPAHPARPAEGERRPAQTRGDGGGHVPRRAGVGELGRERRPPRQEQHDARRPPRGAARRADRATGSVPRTAPAASPAPATATRKNDQYCV